MNTAQTVAGWVHAAALCPIAVLVFGALDLFTAWREKRKAKREQEELELVCACCGLDACDRDGMVWVARSGLSVRRELVQA